jgi:acetyl-CoA synthetase
LENKASQAIAKHDWETLAQEARADLTGFWARHARELNWYQPWQQVLDESRAPFYSWFTGARCNIVANALDRHLKTHRKDEPALIWESEDGATTRVFSYKDVHHEVCRCALLLKKLGVTKGTRVTIYLPRIPEIVFVMLACAKIGAIHSVVFGGFSVDALSTRITDCQSSMVVTSDGSYIKGRVLELKKTVDQALEQCPSVKNVLVIKRCNNPVTMHENRDFWYPTEPASAQEHRECPTEELEASDPLFILYTSGSTGKPKAILHAHGGYMVGVYTTCKYIFDLHETDRWWCTADPGWITGHSYEVYGPLMHGATVLLFEGGPTTPEPDCWWRLIAKHKITIFYTAPTAIRCLMRLGDDLPKKHDLSSLRLLGTVGEPINPDAWKWFYTVIGKGRCPIMDTWWQTETGMCLIAPIPSLPLKPGSATRPFFGQEAEILDTCGRPVPDGCEGYLVLTKPWPAMMCTVFGNPDRYVRDYWSMFPGKYCTGDGAKRDKDGYFWIIGRIDDVIKVSGHSLGTAEIESALASHPAVAEVAAIGLPHEVKGQGIHAFVVLQDAQDESPELAEALRTHVAQHMGAIARPEDITFIDSLPKTRSGKIMRRVLKARALGLPEGDLSTCACDNT